MRYTGLLAAGLLLLSGWINARPVADSFLLKGKIIGLEKGEVLCLSYIDRDGARKMDSVVPQGGMFEFRGALAGPTLARFYLSGSRDESNQVNLFLENKVMSLSLTKGAFPEALMSGSITGAELLDYQRKTYKVRKRWSNVMDTLSAINKRSNFEYQAVRSWVLVPYNREINEIAADFIRKHPQSYTTAYLLRFYGRELATDTLKKMYAAFPPAVQRSIHGTELLNEIKKRQIGIPGTVASNFKADDINGQPVQLSDYKGKYVLLDFWASWCLPCRQLNPHMKELYARYQQRGFEVIGVSDDDKNPAAWRSAVAQDGLPWKHVLRGYQRGERASSGATDINAQFGVSVLPTYILIDKEGKIIGRYSGEGKDTSELDRLLEKIFGKS